MFNKVLLVFSLLVLSLYLINFVLDRFFNTDLYLQCLLLILRMS